MQETQPQDRTPAEAVRSTRCVLCRRRPGRACTPRGDHVGRWLQAYGERRISRDELVVVITELTIVTKWCVVEEDAA